MVKYPIIIKYITVVLWISFSLISCQNEVIRVSDTPGKDLTPMEVVVSQLVALQNNDIPAEDHGITVAFAFASPENKNNTGPIVRFRKMLRSRPYEPLINHIKYQVSEHFINENEAQFFVEVTSRENKIIKYIFELSLVSERPYTGFWMTSSVIPISSDLENPHDNTVNI